MPADRTRRIINPRDKAEAAFRNATSGPAEEAPKSPVIPHAKELVSIRIDQDVLHFFQGDGPGWQERINDALRKVAGL